MNNLPNCPKCDSQYTYEDGAFLICPECAHEWSAGDSAAESSDIVVKDSNGNVLNDGDSRSEERRVGKECRIGWNCRWAQEK